jgi:four helix bundle protein
MSIQSYRELEIWQVAMDLAQACYRLTMNYPKAELFGLTSQIRRSAAAVPANIAEGQGRQHTREFPQFLGVARGSLFELETHLELSRRVGLLTEDDLAKLLTLTARIGQMSTRLCAALKDRL